MDEVRSDRDMLAIIKKDAVLDANHHVYFIMFTQQRPTDQCFAKYWYLSRENQVHLCLNVQALPVSLMGIFHPVSLHFTKYLLQNRRGT